MPQRHAMALITGSPRVSLILRGPGEILWTTDHPNELIASARVWQYSHARLSARRPHRLGAAVAILLIEAPPPEKSH
jgi:hypothetical protein